MSSHMTECHDMIHASLTVQCHDSIIDSVYNDE